MRGVYGRTANPWEAPVRLTLPLPPGVNNQYVTVSHKRVLSKEATAFKKQVMAAVENAVSHDAALKGRPTGFRVPIREVRASMGAGFLYPLLGEMRTMPGLPSEPNTWKIDLDDDGNVVGLF